MVSTEQFIELNNNLTLQFQWQQRDLPVEAFVVFGLGTALQIFKAFDPKPIYPFISYRADFCSSSIPNRTKPYPFENPDESRITLAVFIDEYLFENTRYKL